MVLRSASQDVGGSVNVWLTMGMAGSGEVKRGCKESGFGGGVILRFSTFRLGRGEARPPDSLISLFLCALCGLFVAIRANSWLIICENPRHPWFPSCQPRRLRLLRIFLDPQPPVEYNIYLTNRGFLIWRTKLQLKRPSRRGRDSAILHFAL